MPCAVGPLRRDQLAHLVRAAGAILQADDVVVIGSQAIVGSYDEMILPAEVILSIEADIAPIGDDDGRRADLIDGSIGEASMFHEAYGVYAQGVDLSTALVASGWRDRLLPLVDPATGTTGWCLDVHDLCAAKLLAARPKDGVFVGAVIGARLADPAEIGRLLDDTDVGEERRQPARAKLAAMADNGLPAAGRASWWRRRHSWIADRLRQAPRRRPEL